MARRGRPRKRLSRMDAATDAMTAFGFDERLVQNSVKQLLKEYGGDDGWAFIEEYGYKELIDAILRDQETNDEQKQGVSSQDERANDPALQSILGPSGSLVCSICNEAANTVGETSCSELVNAVAPMHVELCRNKQDISSPEVFCRPLVEGDGNTSKDVAEDEIPTQKEVSNAICRDGGNSRNQVQPGSYFDVFDRPPTSSRYPVNYLKLCSGSQVQSESNFHISTPPPTASLCPVNHLPVPVDHHPTALPSSKGASSQDEIAENPALESTTGPSGTLVDSTCYKAGNTVGETTCSKLVDAVGEPTHEELCSYKQDIGSTGDSESAEARFDQAAKYWKQAIALTPEVLCLPPAEGDGHRCKDIREDQTSIQKGIGNVFFSDGGDSGSRALQASVNSVPTPADHLPTNLPSSKRVFLQPPRRRFPCYGWIGSDSEEDADDFIQLPQMILHRV
ncbi:uncharacterized protein LOC107845438 isoform X1 [Capsicum annuum]|uniref:uncharacterized protein LOC107845438 isoform X1 n=1 Tax=Capsicum annuum TaxID=4072 RepID=UPI001FB0CB39|nr:uncharacterized protein LOC107845438 isoform X1 [Capsicum annuum]